MANESIKRPIRGFMARSFSGRTIADDSDIFALGFGNSLFAIQLVSFVEGEFAIEIDGSELELANFKSIDALATLVQAKLDTRA